MSRTSTLSGSSLAQPIPLAAARPALPHRLQTHAERLSKVQSVDQRMCLGDAVSAFANCGRAVAHVRGRCQQQSLHLMQHSETSSRTLALSRTQMNESNCARISLRHGPIPFAVRKLPSGILDGHSVRHALVIPSSLSEAWGGSSFLPSWHRRHLAEDVCLRCLSEDAPTWFWCTIDAGPAHYRR
jgi:hypothetical protein